MQTTLSARNYTDPAIYETEKNRVFSTTWQYAGHIEKLRKTGDYFVCDVAGQSLIIIRNKAGEIAAFHNVCPHRAARLLSGEGCKKRFACRNHAWTFDTDGRLVSAPNASKVNGFETGNYRLKSCATEVLHGLVFVNLAVDPKPLAQLADGLEQELRDHAPNLPELHFVHRTEATIAANWKVLIENYSECYHCLLNHKGFVNGVVDPASYRISVHGLWQKHSSQSRTGEARVYHYEEQARAHSNEFGAWYLWPNFAFQSYPGGAVHVWSWTALDTATTRVTVDWYFPGSDLKDWEKELIRHHAATTFAEDLPLVESMQQGFSSGVYDPGPLMIDDEQSVLSEHAVAALQNLWREAMGESL